MSAGFDSADEFDDSLVGKKLGKYQVLRLVGQGGMGVVYEAEDTYLKRRVALKVLSSAIVQDRSARKRFLREARSAASINSPYIVSIFDVDQQDNLIFLVMELFPGTNVQDHLAATGPFDWRAATLIVAAACRGLSAVHARGIVHRDIKPSNIMLSARGARELGAPSAAGEYTDESVKLADFGLAKFVSGEESPMTSANTVLGTPLYMSPEQCRAESLDARSDVYSLGATYFALLTGRPPFLADQPIQIMFAHCSAPVPDVRQHVPQASPGCQAIVERALAKEPLQRYQSIDDLRTALLALVGVSRNIDSVIEAPPVVASREDRQTVSISPQHTSPHSTQPRSRSRKLDRRVVAFAVTLCLAVVLASALGYAGYRIATRDSQTKNGNAGWGSPKSADNFVVEARQFPASGQVQALALSHNGKLLARGLIGNPGSGRVCDLRTNLDLPHALVGDRDDTYLRSVAFLPGSEILAATVGVKVWLFEPTSGKKWPVVTLQNAGASRLALAPGKVLLVGEQSWSSGSPQSKLWKYQLREANGDWTATAPEVLVTHPTAIKALAVSPNGRQVTSISIDSVLRLGSVAGGEFESRNLPRHDSRATDYTHSAAFSSDGKLLAAVADRRVLIWNLPQFTEARQFDVEPHSTNIVLAFVPDSHRLASASGSGIKIWNADNGESVGKPYSDHAGESITSLVFVPGSDMLISGGYDKRISIRNWKQSAGLSSHD